MAHYILKIAALAALLGGIAAPATADINDVVVDDSFAYNTRKAVKVDIQVNTPNGDPTGLSFYSKGVDGLRLLDTRVLGADGLYQGKLNVPAYLRTVIVKSRWLDSFQEVELKVTAQGVSAVIDHF
jgi:hypothetical protein